MQLITGTSDYDIDLDKFFASKNQYHSVTEDFVDDVNDDIAIVTEPSNNEASRLIKIH